LKPDKTWSRIYLEDLGGAFRDNWVMENGDQVSEATLSGAIAKDRLALMPVLWKMKHSRYLVVVANKNGDQLLMGNLTTPCKMLVNERKSGESSRPESDRNEYRISTSLRRRSPVPWYAGTVSGTFTPGPDSPIVNSGITELTGDVAAGPGSGSQVATIAADAVTNAKLANMAEGLLKGRAAGAGTGDPQDLTANQVSTILDGATDPFLRTSAATGGTGLNELTGDVTAGPGTGAQAATIANDAVTNAKAANMVQATLKGRAAGAGTGDPTDLTPDQASSVLDTATDPFARTSAIPAAGITQLTGDVIAGPGSGSQAASIANSAVVTAKIADNNVTNAKLAVMANRTLKGSVAGGTPADLTPNDTSTILDNATDPFLRTSAFGNDSVTNAKLANMAQATLKGRASGAGTGDPQDLSANNVSTILDGATDPFLRTSAAPTGGITQLTGDVTAGPGNGSQAGTIANDAVTNAKLANMAQATIKGRQAGAGTGDPEDLTAAQARTAMGLGTAAVVDTGTGSANVPTIAQADTLYAAKGQQLITSVLVDLLDVGYTSTADTVFPAIWTNQPAALSFLPSSQLAYQLRMDCSLYDQVRITVVCPGSGTYVAGSKLLARYRTAAAGTNNTPANWVEMGVSSTDVAVAFSGSGGAAAATSGWFDLTALAKDDILIQLLGVDGNGAADPSFLRVYLEFKKTYTI
jgi:hypothetical protein